MYSENLKKVTLQLSWFDQFQFAGYYMAKEKGFYKELGLDVEIHYFNEVKADLNSFKPANLNVKLTYKLENGKWVLDDKNFLKLLNALVFVKYYNKSVEESL